MNAIDVRGVSHRFGNRAALTDVAFQAPTGAFCVLLGLNGAGKTTLISLLTGLFYARRGSVAIFGRELAREPAEALAGMGIVFQQSTLEPDLSVRENLRYFGALHGLSWRQVETRAADELARVGLSDRLRQTVRSLSGGERRRLEIARALLHEPRILILDEPTIGLDVPSRAAILQHVRSLRGRVTVLWATHLLEEVAQDDELIVLHEGKVLRQGVARVVCADERSPNIQAAFHRIIGSRP